MRISLPFGAGLIAVSLGITASGAFAASAIQKECSQKYQAAKSANTLNGMTYNQFYHQCAADAKAGTSATAPAPTPATTPPKPAPAAPAPTTASKPMTPAAPAAAGNAVFPTAVSSEFSSESAGKARMHTCLAQYKANKASNANGGMTWIMKGGGYYSECNKRLKG